MSYITKFKNLLSIVFLYALGIISPERHKRITTTQYKLLTTSDKSGD